MVIPSALAWTLGSIEPPLTFQAAGRRKRLLCTLLAIIVPRSIVGILARANGIGTTTKYRLTQASLDA